MDKSTSDGFSCWCKNCKKCFNRKYHQSKTRRLSGLTPFGIDLRCSRCGFVGVSDFTKWGSFSVICVKCSNKKVCPRCRIEKTFSEFHKDKRNVGGVGSYCKHCSYLIHRAKSRISVGLPKEGTSKRCTKCGKIGPSDIFHRSIQYHTGTCLDCLKSMKSAWNRKAYKRRKHMHKYVSQRKIRLSGYRSRMSDFYIRSILKVTKPEIAASKQLIQQTRNQILLKRTRRFFQDMGAVAQLTQTT